MNREHLENEIKALKYQLLVEKQRHKKTRAKLFHLKNIDGKRYESLKTEFAKHNLFVFNDLELFFWVETLMREFKSKMLSANEELSKKACDVLAFKLEKLKTKN